MDAAATDISQPQQCKYDTRENRNSHLRVWPLALRYPDQQLTFQPCGAMHPDLRNF
jgi:hypothetical protein